MNVSVVMASFNGEQYIRRQIESILCQLKTEDELIISNDTGGCKETLNTKESTLVQAGVIQVVAEMIEEKA